LTTWSWCGVTIPGARIRRRGPVVRGRRPRPPVGGMRFAFYGGISTSGYRDQPSSRRWQYDNADRLITGPG